MNISKKVAPARLLFKRYEELSQHRFSVSSINVTGGIAIQ